MIVRPKHQRLILISLALVALLGAVLLAMWGLQDRAAYFYAPSELPIQRLDDTSSPFRLGGMVEKGSLKRQPDGVTITFNVTDGKVSLPVIYRGILPDLFREGSGVIAECRMGIDGEIYADTILAKHDERYMPPQMGNQATAK